jgi:hypothetical protein
VFVFDWFSNVTIILWRKTSASIRVTDSAVLTNWRGFSGYLLLSGEGQPACIDSCTADKY